MNLKKFIIEFFLKCFALILITSAAEHSDSLNAFLVIILYVIGLLVFDAAYWIEHKWRNDKPCQ